VRTAVGEALEKGDALLVLATSVLPLGVDR
jgi:hypothetical protein